MKQYIDLVKTVLQDGTRKPNRTGIDTLSTFGLFYKHDLYEGFPLLTTKSISWKNIVVENLWFLSGSRDIKLLQKHGCKFWDAWADGEGMVPSAYGNFWRHFPVHTPASIGQTCRDGCDPVAEYNDQIAWVLAELVKNPMSRRMVVSAWAPGNAQTSKLPPCHALFTLNVQLTAKGKKRLCLHLTQRSCDIALGVPYNLAGYTLLLQLFAHLANGGRHPDEHPNGDGLYLGTFAHSLLDAHAYTAKADGSKAEFDHVPGLKEQIERAPRQLPFVKISESIRSLADIEDLVQDGTTEELLAAFELCDYNPHPAIPFKVAV